MEEIDELNEVIRQLQDIFSDGNKSNIKDPKQGLFIWPFILEWALKMVNHLHRTYLCWSIIKNLHLPQRKLKIFTF